MSTPKGNNIKPPSVESQLRIKAEDEKEDREAQQRYTEFLPHEHWRRSMVADLYRDSRG